MLRHFVCFAHITKKILETITFSFSFGFTAFHNSVENKKKDNRWKDVKERQANCVLKLQPTGEKAVIL